MARAFLVVAPDGSQHVRESESRIYSHAILFGPDNGRDYWSAPKFSSRHDLAEKEAATCRKNAAHTRPEMEIVVAPTIEITPAQARRVRKGEVLDVNDLTPAQVLRHHVTGAVERGEAEAIVEIPADPTLVPAPTFAVPGDDNWVEPGDVHPDEVAMGFATVPVNDSIDPAALFLLDMNWINMFEPVGNGNLDFHCKLCGGKTRVQDREAHYTVHKTTPNLKAQQWADRRATMAAKTPKTKKQTAAERGVPAVYLGAGGNFKPGGDAQYKSDLIATVLGRTKTFLHKFTPADAHKRLEEMGWLNHLAKSQKAEQAKAERKAAAANRAKAQAAEKADKRQAKPDPKPARKARKKAEPKVEAPVEAPVAS